MLASVEDKLIKVNIRPNNYIPDHLIDRSIGAINVSGWDATAAVLVKTKNSFASHAHCDNNVLSAEIASSIFEHKAFSISRPSVDLCYVSCTIRITLYEVIVVGVICCGNL